MKRIRRTFQNPPSPFPCAASSSAKCARRSWPCSACPFYREKTFACVNRSSQYALNALLSSLMVLSIGVMERRHEDVQSRLLESSRSTAALVRPGPHLRRQPQSGPMGSAIDHRPGHIGVSRLIEIDRIRLGQTQQVRNLGGIDELVDVYPSAHAVTLRRRPDNTVCTPFVDGSRQAV